MPRANHVEIVMACDPDEVAAHSDRTLEAEFVAHKNGSVLIVFQVIVQVVLEPMARLNGT